MTNVKLCLLMVFAATLLGLMSLPAAAVSTSNRPDGSEPVAPQAMAMSDGNCVVYCPLGATVEAESCGEDLNGGCNMSVPVFEPIALGQTICGTAFAGIDGNSIRDTDWYEVTITAPTTLILTVKAEFQVQIFLMYPLDSNQPISCYNYTHDTNSAPACTDVQVSRDCQPGTYWLWVGTQAFDGNPCGSGSNNYVLTLKSPYCDASGGCDEYISNVSVGTINNTSDCGGYADYTALSTEMTAGGAYPITVTNGNPYDGDQCGIWADWNQDGDFDDPNETITVGGTPGMGPYTALIAVPPDANTGNTRMRIRIAYTDGISPCGETIYGEVEDYTIIVLPYCPARGDFCDEYISNVSVGTINNTSACDGYADYTALSTEITAGGIYEITVTNGNPYAPDQCGIWVDWNDDGDFYDMDEAITVNDTPGGGPYTAGIAAPPGASFGNIRMRIRIAYTGEISPCGDTTYGEVEDYTLRVLPNADLNRDGFVDFIDFAFFAEQWLTVRP